MKQLKLIILSFYLASLFLSCNAQSGDNIKSSSENGNEKIDVYYFHFTRRCITCRAVEEQSKLAIEQLYPDKIIDGLVAFTSVNLDLNSSQEIAKKFNVSGQSLLVVKGEKSVDLTYQGFIYARSNPSKLKAEIKNAIDNL